MSNPNPIPPATLLDDLHPARFLKPADLLDRWHVQNLPVTISRMTKEPTTPSPHDLDPATADSYNPKGKPRVVAQPVLYFATKDGAEFPRGYLLSAGVDIASLKSATGARTVGELAGKRITITVGEHKHQTVLRISPQPTPQPADKAADGK
jgi:hypothetical protein